jgi:hypothetical protein
MIARATSVEPDAPQSNSDQSNFSPYQEATRKLDVPVGPGGHRSLWPALWSIRSGITMQSQNYPTREQVIRSMIADGPDTSPTNIRKLLNELLISGGAKLVPTRKSLKPQIVSTDWWAHQGSMIKSPRSSDLHSEVADCRTSRGIKLREEQISRTP